MKVGVCIKSTPDTDTRIKIAGDGEGIDTNGIKWIISPYDSFALEEGAQLKTQNGGECVIFTVGGSTATKNIRDGLALGADRAVQIDDDAMNNTDALGVARALAAAIQAEGMEIVFTGRQAIDDDNVQVPAMLAELLGWAHVSMVSEFNLDGDSFTAVRNVGGGTRERISGKLPVVITADRGLNTPRFPKLPDIMKAKAKKIATKSIADLGLAKADVAPAVTISQYGPPPARPQGRILEGDVTTQVQELVRLLREEAKVL